MRYEMVDPIYTAARWLTGEDIAVPTDEKLDYCLTLHLLGLGARAIRNGGRLWRYPCPWDLKEGWIRAYTREWDTRHEKFTGWRSATHKAARKERFVTNPYGRRAYHLSAERAQMFLLLSTPMDALKIALYGSDAPVESIGFAWVDTPATDLHTPAPFTLEITQ